MEYTTFENDLKTKFKNKNLNDTTIKYYLRSLQILNDDEPLENVNFLNKVSFILNKLSDYKPNTKRNYIITICSTLSVLKKTNTKAYKKYFEELKKMNSELKAQEKENVKSQTQEKNWLEWSEIKNKYDSLKEKVDNFKNNQAISKEEYNTLLQFIILSLYYLLPPRRNEYLNMNVIFKENKNLSNDKNYLDYDNKEFIFNSYKTAKTEGQLKIKIPNELFDNINIYLKYQPNIKLKNNKPPKNINDPFLVDSNGEPLKHKNSLTVILNKIFKPKRISSSMLRHIYLSDRYKDLNEEKKKDAIAMGHSVNMQNDYVKK